MVNESGTKGSIFDLNSFLADLERREIEIDVVDGKEIRKSCEVSTLHRTREAFLQRAHRKYRLVFEGDNPENTWPSDSRPGWIVINLAHSVHPSDLVGMIDKAVKRGKRVEKEEHFQLLEDKYLVLY